MNWWNRRLRSGYSDLGRVQIPPRPQIIILTDRVDGSQWMVSFNSSAPERLSIVSTFSTIQRLEGARIYSANEGPTMDEDGEFILFIRGGRIGLEYSKFAIGEIALADAPPYARQTSDQRQLNLDSINPRVVHLGYKA